MSPVQYSILHGISTFTSSIPLLLTKRSNFIRNLFLQEKENRLAMTLYAKSFDKQQDLEKNILLLSHLKFSFWAAEAILNCTAEQQLEVIGIDKSQLERFRHLVLMAAAIHDLGKANSLFQGAVKGNNDKQSIRHEWLLFLLLRFSPLGTWIRDSCENDNDFTILVWAITGHHRKTKAQITISKGKGMQVLLGNSDFQDCLKWIAQEFHLPDPPLLDPQGVNDKDLKELLQDLEKPGDTIKDSLNKKRRFEEDDNIADDWCDWAPSDRVLMSAVRTVLMSADVVASALADPAFCTNGKELTRDQIHDWVKKSLGHLPTPAQYGKIVEQRQRQIAAMQVSGPKNTTLDQERDAFQDKVALSKSRVTLVSAGCGSGKTLAAFRWALNNARPAGNRLFFGYPTTGTATEGFLNYLFDDNEKMGDLIHSRVAVDFLLNDRMKNAAFDGEDDDCRAEIIRSLRLWSTGIVCCTVDTMLGFLVNAYSGHLAWPALAQSIFIFDEIHSYDETLFRYLLRFLRIAKGMPILLMTASLPKKRLQQLSDVLADQKETLGIIHGPNEWEQVERYQRFRPEDDSEDAAIDEVITRYEQGEKILWVCNTVGRAIRIAKNISERSESCQLVVYHSHFRYEDRVKRHAECVKAFRKKGGVICVTTQVAEMSLDISADFLLMDLAPVAAMIQRLGRLNRRAIFNGTKPFWVIFPKKKNGEPTLVPYSSDMTSTSKNKEIIYPEWYQESRSWLDKLGDKPLCQAVLAESWNAIASDDSRKEYRCPAPWSAPGPDMNHGNLRDASPGCEVILKEDLDLIKHGGTLDYLRCVLPMTQPYNTKIKLEKHPKYGCFVVEKGKQIDYSSNWGGLWISENDVHDSSREIHIY